MSRLYVMVFVMEMVTQLVGAYAALVQEPAWAAAMFSLAVMFHIQRGEIRR